MQKKRDLQSKNKPKRYRLSPFSRTSYLALAIFLIAYSLFTASAGIMRIPSRYPREYEMPLGTFSSWLMCLAALCASANLIACAMQPESRKHDARYKSIYDFTKVFGWLFFILAIVAAILETRRPPID